MISRRITIQPKNDRYRRLALYIADAGRKGEKALLSWCAGGWSDDDYELAITEVEMVQATNVRTTKEKTYHLLVSFRPEDEDKLTPEVLKEIELEFAQALGLSEHQRHAGVHKNTDNLHLHVAINLIHPERRTRHEPFRDYWIRDKLCRELEQRYSLTVDQGRQPDKAATGPEPAKAFEAHTGQESFFSYARKQLDFLHPALAKARSWPEAHTAFQRRGLKLKPHGNGLVVQDFSGRQAIKASDLDRDFSKARLEKRFGLFLAPGQDLAAVKPNMTYSAAPLQVDANRARLYDEYQAALEKRRAALAGLKEQEGRLFGIYRQKWAKKRAEIKRLPMLRRHRRETMDLIRRKESAELAALRREMKIRRDKIRAEYPFSSWSQFLQHRAGRGQEEALAVLRSRNEKVWAALSRPGRQGNLESVAKLREIMGGQAVGLKYRLDGKGTIFFSLPGGGTIRDSGTAIHFRPDDEMTKNLAGKLAQARWGEAVSLTGNTLKPKSAGEERLNRVPSPALGLSR